MIFIVQLTFQQPHRICSYYFVVLLSRGFIAVYSLYASMSIFDCSMQMKKESALQKNILRNQTPDLTLLTYYTLILSHTVTGCSRCFQRSTNRFYTKLQPRFWSFQVLLPCGIGFLHGRFFRLRGSESMRV